MYTDNLRRQHRDILAIVDKMHAVLKVSGDLDLDSSGKLRKLLVELSGCVKVHLAAEDKSVYPQLQSHTDSRISDVAGKFAREMGGIAEVFKNYVSHWGNPETIRANPTQFASETNKVASALVTRIRREESELYPLVD